MAAVFLWGVLRHPPLRHAVLGREVPVRPALLPGHRTEGAGPAGWPRLLRGGAGAEGLLADRLTEDEVARLDFYLGGDGAGRDDVLAGVASAPALVFGLTGDDGTPPSEGWDLAGWVAVWGATATRAAAEALRLMGQKPAGAVRARQPQRLTRAGAALRAAAQGAPADLRRRATPGDVAVAARSEPYARYFAIEEYDLTHRRFDGGMSAEVNRAVFISGDAAVVLPYDPARDRVLLVEQFRPGPFGRGDPQPWLIEAVAGRIDGGETPEAAARREAREEAGLELGRLIPVADYYPSPAAKAEYIYSWIGIADLPDDAGRLGGVDDEGEDIRGHVVAFERLMRLVASGEINNAPLLILALWLERNRDTLRGGPAADAGGG